MVDFTGGFQLYHTTRDLYERHEEVVNCKEDQEINVIKGRSKRQNRIGAQDITSEALAKMHLFAIVRAVNVVHEPCLLSRIEKVFELFRVS